VKLAERLVRRGDEKPGRGLMGFDPAAATTAEACWKLLHDRPAICDCSAGSHCHVVEACSTNLMYCVLIVVLVLTDQSTVLPCTNGR
jgi:hypothetical protein